MIYFDSLYVNIINDKSISFMSISAEVSRRLGADAVLYRLTELFVSRRPPDYIRSDNGPEFTAKAVRGWLGRIGVKTLYIEPGSPWENGYNESFNGKLRMGRKIKGRVSTLPIHLLPHRALRLLSSRALSSRWAGRLYHDPLR